MESAGWLAGRMPVDSHVHYGDLLMEVGGTEGSDDKRVSALREEIALDRSDLDPTDQERERERAQYELVGMTVAHDRVEVETTETRKRQ